MVCGSALSDAATPARASSSAYVTTQPGLAWTASTTEKTGAYSSLKFRLPLTRGVCGANRVKRQKHYGQMTTQQITRFGIESLLQVFAASEIRP